MATSSKAAVSESPALYGDEAPYTITLQLRGVTPFLFNQMDLDAYEETGPGKKKQPRKKPNYESMVWRDERGCLVYPVSSVIASLAAAGKYFRSPIASSGSAANTLTQGLVPGCAVASFGCKGWDCIDRRLARNSDPKRSPKPTYRPRLDVGWLLSDVQVTVVTPELYAPARMLEIITRAGSVCGIGDGRRIGMGRFVIGGHEVAEGLPWE